MGDVAQQKALAYLPFRFFVLLGCDFLAGFGSRCWGPAFVIT
jgi:hypothetical protein